MTQELDRNSRNSPRVNDHDNNYTNTYEALACKYALLMIQTSIDISSALIVEMPDNLKLCLAYSALVITQYTPDKDITPDIIYDSLKALESKARSHPFLRPNVLTATLIARHRVEKRCWEQAQNTTNRHEIMSPCRHASSATGFPLHQQHTSNVSPTIETHRSNPGETWREDELDDIAALDIETLFPSMEDFFAGGFSLPELEPGSY